jgi:thiol-disulfide isomerase/thioredoxin
MIIALGRISSERQNAGLNIGMTKLTAKIAFLLVLTVVASCGIVGEVEDNQSEVLTVTTVSGPELMALVRSSEAKAVLLNVWATWCRPCVEEFPELLKIRRDYKDKGLEVLLVSADFEDQREKMVSFLREQGVDFEVYFKTGKDAEFIDALNPRWEGALPATLLFDGKGEMVHFWNAKVTYEQLKDTLLAVLNSEVTLSEGE